MKTLSAAYLYVLDRIACSFLGLNTTWALTGSANLALQGVNVQPKDVDILSDRDGVYQLENRLSRYMVKRVEFGSIDDIRSHHGMARIGDVDIDLIGDMENQLQPGTWEPHETWQENIVFIRACTYSIPALSLQYEHKIYTKLRNLDLAGRITTRLETENRAYP